MDKFNELRQKYDTFIYHGYNIDDDGFSFDFSIGEYKFRPQWRWNGFSPDKNADSALTEHIVFCIGMTELVSYWKCACPPNVTVKCGSLDEYSINWWKKLYFGGLGEFFYRNGIETDINSFMTIKAENMSGAKKFRDPFQGERKGALIPVGGGKDSIVTLELLSGMKKDNLCYMVNDGIAPMNCARTAGYTDDSIVCFKRSIDKALLERNAAGWLNGHTPFSAIVAFSSYLAAVITGKKYIALSNESSANEGNISGSDVNHQYSKSTGFESDFREYCKRYFLPEPQYFSFLRPWSEWQITKRFVTYEKYLDVFRSCNAGSKKGIWCGKCAKCLYVYIMLSAFLDDERLVSIFGRDMLDDEEMSGIFDGLVYPDTEKPFECVGTRAEVALALYNSYLRRKDGKLPLLLDRYMKTAPSVPQELDSFFDSGNYVPAELIGLLK